MKKRVFASLLALAMLLSLLPAAAFAAAEGEPDPDTSGGPGEAVTLDIADGSITITESGYTQGDAEEETAHTGPYILTGPYVDPNTAAVTADTNQVKIHTGSGDAEGSDGQVSHGE